MDAKDLKEVAFCTGDAVNWLSARGLKNISSVQIKHLLQSEWELKPASNSNSYTQYNLLPDGRVSETKNRGRFYQITHHFISYFDENDEKIDK